MNPYIDMPSVEETLCEVGGCPHERAWQAEDDGPWLCEDHADLWMRGGEIAVRRSGGERVRQLVPLRRAS